VSKITVIIPTNQSPIQCLAWSLLSLYLRSDVSKIESVIVSINGPDSRTGETSCQDDKFCLCQKFQDYLPITIIRTWSRCAIGAAMQAAMPLVKTDKYLLMHDDVIVLSQDWQQEAENAFESGAAAIVTPPILDKKFTVTILENHPNEANTAVYAPSLNICFSMFRTSDNLKWLEYHLKKNDVNTSSVNDFYKSHPERYTSLMDDYFKVNIKKLTRLEIFNKKISSNFFQYDCGAWPAEKIKNQPIAKFNNHVTYHFETMSHKKTALWEAEHPGIIPRQLLEECQTKHPEILNFIPKIGNKIPDFSSLRPLVCVVVYDRVETIAHWIKAWKESEKYNGKLLIVQNIDDSKNSEKVTNAIKELQPDYHWQRTNDNESCKHWFELLDFKEIDFDWNILCTFTDDCIPLRKDFLMPFLNMFANDDKLGATGGLEIYDRSEILEDHYFCRSVCVAFRKECIKEIKKIALLSKPQKIPSGFSILCENQIFFWAKKTGYNVAPTNHHWSLIFGWDCDHDGIRNLWEKSNFNLFNK